MDAKEDRALAMNAPQDQDRLLTRFAAGDRAAIGPLLDREWPHLRSIVERSIPRRLRRRYDESDVRQLVAMRLLRSQARFTDQGGQAFRRMLRVLADRALVTLYQKETAQCRSPERQVPSAAVASGFLDALPEAAARRRPDSPTPSRVVIDREQCNALRRAFARLSAADREVLLLIERDGLNYAATAIQLRTSPEAARKRYGRALERLRVLMENATRGGDG